MENTQKSKPIRQWTKNL